MFFFFYLVSEILLYFFRFSVCFSCTEYHTFCALSNNLDCQYVSLVSNIIPSVHYPTIQIFGMFLFLSNMILSVQCPTINNFRHIVLVWDMLFYCTLSNNLYFRHFSFVSNIQCPIIQIFCMFFMNPICYPIVQCPAKKKLRHMFVM